MLRILINDQILKPQRVCQTCLLADASGQPRTRKGKLCCGQAVGKFTEQQPDQYECMMGFKIVNIE